MKTARVELFQVPPPWLFLKLTTDDGLSGWGNLELGEVSGLVKSRLRKRAWLHEAQSGTLRKRLFTSPAPRSVQHLSPIAL